MAIEIRDNQHIQGVKIKTPIREITSHSHKQKQTNNKDDRISMYADDSSTIITTKDQVKTAKEDIHNYEKASCSKLNENKTKLIKLGKARSEYVTNKNIGVNFEILKDEEKKNT